MLQESFHDVWVECNEMKKWTIHDEMRNEMMKWTMKRWNEQWNDETLEGLSKSVKHTKWPSALAYYEMNSHIKWVSKYEAQMC